jgi:hypothetical protein
MSGSWGEVVVAARLKIAFRPAQVAPSGRRRNFCEHRNPYRFRKRQCLALSSIDVHGGQLA